MNYLARRDSSDPEVARILNLETVPPVTTTRWSARRKAQVVAAVQAGLLSIDEVCEFYDLSLEEFLDWQRTIRIAGVRGLQVSKLGFSRTVSHRVHAMPQVEEKDHV